ncbi:hypothetical protein BAN20980_04723 [Burkholderia anthina]|uniref:Uncharacterized protein n=1 Tax=Burkholderia anthina TaxID=179879 RepID=A0A6P2GDY6_9BURK|nr:hypothetical protein BAN20980_04723 [Burkholderia anthina]
MLAGGRRNAPIGTRNEDALTHNLVEHPQALEIRLRRLRAECAPIDNFVQIRRTRFFGRLIIRLLMRIVRHSVIPNSGHTIHSARFFGRMIRVSDPMSELGSAFQTLSHSSGCSPCLARLASRTSILRTPTSAQAGPRKKVGGPRAAATNPRYRVLQSSPRIVNPYTKLRIAIPVSMWFEHRSRRPRRPKSLSSMNALVNSYTCIRHGVVLPAPCSL